VHGICLIGKGGPSDPSALDRGSGTIFIREISPSICELMTQIWTVAIDVPSMGPPKSAEGVGASSDA
jgi:hypothetical protein